MSEVGTNARVLAFLREEKSDLERRISRLRGAVRDCENSQEREGLQALLHAAQIELGLIEDLFAGQQSEAAVSLEAAIMDGMQRTRQERQRQARTWQRGKRTSSDYWDAAIKQTALQDVLRRYHAWTHGETLYARRSAATEPPGGRDTHAYPWYPQPESARDDSGTAAGDYRQRRDDHSRSAEMLYEAIIAALEPLHVPKQHVDIIAEPLGYVIVMGYAHDEGFKQRIIETLLDVDGVFEVIEHIQVVEARHCPACRDATNRPLAGVARRDGGRQHTNGKR